MLTSENVDQSDNGSFGNGKEQDSFLELLSMVQDILIFPLRLVVSSIESSFVRHEIHSLRALLMSDENTQKW